MIPAASRNCAKYCWRHCCTLKQNM